MTYVRRKEVAMAAPIMKWIASKQNSLGGYASTQVIVHKTMEKRRHITPEWNIASLVICHAASCVFQLNRDKLA